MFPSGPAFAPASPANALDSQSSGGVSTSSASPSIAAIYAASGAQLPPSSTRRWSLSKLFPSSVRLGGGLARRELVV
jgi:thymidine phosphorylase